jgi:basic membrane lipoprotein Med (substrate-binding protein (PBP1-ABC) superfamily)
VKQAGIRPGQVLTVTAAAFVIAAGLLTWLFWPSAQRIPGAERVRQYSNVRACMLTGADGVANSVAAAAWAGMQGASSSSRAMISYLPVARPGGEAAAEPYLASLVQRQCGVIVAVGPAQVAAATSQADRYRQIHFIVISAGPSGPSTSRVVRIAAAPTAQVHAAVQAAVSAAVNG